MKRSLALLLLAACGGGSSDEENPGLSKRPLKPDHLALVKRFADAVVRKDYKAAYEEMAADYRKDVGWDEFEKSITRYRESTEAVPTFTIKATEDDPKKIVEDGVVELFVPEAQRPRIVEEAAVHFKVKEKDGEDGFWALICWIVDESGSWKILNYYQDD